MKDMKECIMACEDCIKACELCIKYNKMQFNNSKLNITKYLLKLCVKACKKHKPNKHCEKCIILCKTN